MWTGRIGFWVVFAFPFVFFVAVHTSAISRSREPTLLCFSSASQADAQSMVISSVPDPLHCGNDTVVPNVLHMVWSSSKSSGCSGYPVQALVCFLRRRRVRSSCAGTALGTHRQRKARTSWWHLQPEAVFFWIDTPTSNWPSPNCSIRSRRGRSGGRGSDRSLLRIGERLRQCLDAAKVSIRRINWEDRAAPLVKATATFKVASQLHKRTLRPSSVSDIVREFALLSEGGWYLDMDAFVLSRGMAEFRRCPQSVPPRGSNSATRGGSS